MKKIILLIMFLGMFGFAASSASAQYTRVPNAAISGHNTRTMNGSVSDCKRVCNANGWCKSFDYHKGKNKCDLSNKNRQDVGLKTNYGGNPYDHYSKILTRTSSCNPNANQISLFYDANYKGRCVTKNIGNYSSAVSIGLPNDSISSIKVGANVGALLCKDVNYRGTCETYRSNDTFLGNNSIGNDQVSSIKVFRKVGTPTAPNQSSVNLNFVNRTGSPASTYWVKGNSLTVGGGTEVFYKTLNKNQTYSQQTYINHLWRVKIKGKTVGTYRARSSNRSIEIISQAVNAGPIFNQSQANTKCNKLAGARGGAWTGGWWTTVPGRMSVCEIATLRK